MPTPDTDPEVKEKPAPEAAAKAPGANVYDEIFKSFDTKALSSSITKLYESASLEINNIFTSTANKPSEVSATDGTKWTKNKEGAWEVSKDGKPVEHKLSGKISDVSKDSAGNVTFKLNDDTSVVQKTDKSEVTQDDRGRATEVKYGDGTTREFKYDGDNLVGTKTRENKYFDRQKDAKGDYQDSWSVRNTNAPPWTGKIGVTADGAYNYTPATGSEAGIRNTVNTDESKETITKDGSREVKYPNNTVLGYDPSGNMKKMVTPDGTQRTFTLKDNELTGLQVKTKDNKEYRWEKQTDGSWTVNGEKSTFKFDIDSKAGTYKFNDTATGEKNTLDVKGNRTVETTDGRKLQYDNEKLMNTTKGDRSIDYSYDSSKVSTITERKDGQVSREWKPGAQGGWEASTGEKAPGKVAFNDKGEPRFESNNSGTRIGLDGSLSSFKRDEKTKALVEETEGKVRTESAKGTVHDYSTEKDKSGKVSVKEETRTVNGKAETWVKEGTNENGESEWRNKDSGIKETRKNESFENGAYSYEAKGTKHTFRADGTESRVNESEKWSADLADGNATKITYPGGKSRTFTYEDGKVKTVSVAYPDDATKNNTWTRVGKEDKFSDGKTNWNVNFKVDDTKYTVDDAENSKLTVRSSKGETLTEYTKEKKVVETIGDDEKPVRININGAERTFGYDDKGEANRITEGEHSLRRQEDGSWKRFADKDNKEAPDGHARIGKPNIDDKGKVSFRTDDSKVIRQEIGGKIEEIAPKHPLAEKVNKNEKWSDEAKIRFIENANDFLNRTNISVAEKELTMDQIARFDTRQGENPMSEEECNKLMDQAMAHVAHPSEDSQGQHPTCNVTDIRLILEHETPHLAVKLVADVAMDRKFVTADKSVIGLPEESLKPDKEARDWPGDGTRSWFGQISDVTMANIHWKRQLVDPAGYRAQAKGYIQYEEIKPDGKIAGGSRVYRYDPLGNGSFTKSEVAKEPSLHADKIQDIFQQITGKPEEGRVIVHSSRRGGNGALTVNSQDELHKALAGDPRMRIIEGQNNVLYGLKPDGKNHEHVVVVAGYNATEKKGAIEQSHYEKDDLLKPEKQPSLDQMYKYMSAKVPTGQVQNVIYAENAAGRTQVVYRNQYGQNVIGYMESTPQGQEPSRAESQPTPQPQQAQTAYQYRPRQQTPNYYTRRGFR